MKNLKLFQILCAFSVVSLISVSAVSATFNSLESALRGTYSAVLSTPAAEAGLSGRIDQEIQDRNDMDNQLADAIDYNTQAIQKNRVSIGDMNFGRTRYIANAPDLSSAVRTLDENLARLDDRLEKNNKEMKRGFASLAAMTRLVPNGRSCKRTQIAVGTGFYRGTAGLAIGAFHYVHNNLLLNAGVGYAGQDSLTFGVGVTFGF